MRRCPILGVLALGAILSAAVPGAANGQSLCYDYLNRTTYDGGFSSSDFSSLISVDVTGGKLVLNTRGVPLDDTNRIVVPATQDLTVHFVGDETSKSHSFGYFLWDANVSAYTTTSSFNYTATTCTTSADCTVGLTCEANGATKYCASPRYALRDDTSRGGGTKGDGVFDWIEGLYFRFTKNGTPVLHWGATNYSDLGTYSHIPNLLETLVANGGQWIFLLTDDDSDTSVFGDLAPVADSSSSVDGIPDYDVNGDGTIDADDRVVELGSFAAGTELVFFIVTYSDTTAREPTVGKPSKNDLYDDDTESTRIIPYFSKRVLNPDYLQTGTSQKTIDIGCAAGTTCSGVSGWLSQATLDRLSSLYGLNLPHESKTFNTRVDGLAEHIFLGDPSTDPGWWLLGFESGYDGGNRDYNDFSFLVFRSVGGEVTSNVVSLEIPVGDRPNTTITQVRLRKSDSIPAPPCSSDPAKTRIDYYVSIGPGADGYPLWMQVVFPASSPDETTIDMQALGLTGSELRWKAVIFASDSSCKPEILDVDLGYEALKSGEYFYTSPLPLANALFRGSLETRSAAWTVTANDYSNRGHFRMFELYEPSDPETLVKAQIWDAGARLASTNPDSRTIFTNNGGTKVDVATSGGVWLLNEILSATDRAERYNGKIVYDLDGDGDADDDDAKYVIQWTRGWEKPTTEQRAWKLGAIRRSQAAIVHVPGLPSWLEASGIPAAHKTSFNSWASSTGIQDRRSVAYVGAQDGMLHAFDAGAFRWGDNPDTTSIIEQRGHFQFVSGNPDYGSGNELWAFVPPSLLGRLKNNRVRNHFPETNPAAMVDGSIAIADVLHGSAWKTGVFFTMGRVHPYLSALDVSKPATPAPLWTRDWTDADFHGTSAAPSVAWVKPGGTLKWGVATTSGLADTPSDVYLYLIDVEDGQTVTNGKVKLNAGGGIQGDQAFGVAGRPVLVDRNNDGIAERAYVADTNGRIWRHEIEGTAGNVCLVAAVGQPIYATPTFLVQQDTTATQQVAFFFGTGDDPYSNDSATGPYHFLAYVDQDEPGECTLASELYRVVLPADEKIWADAVIAADRVFVAAATGNKADVCSEDVTNPGHIYTYDIDPTSPGVAGQIGAPIETEGNVTSGLVVYDQHVMTNTTGGKTVIVGGSTWNNLASLTRNSGFQDRYWNEVINP